MEFDLERFLVAQEDPIEAITYEEALQSLKDGRSLTDGLCYLFPTLKELGATADDKFFSLSSLYAAYEFWAIPQLRDRLKEITITIARNRRGRSAEEILGEEGAKRFHSCITLFEGVYPGVMFEEANDAYFEGKWDKGTAKLFKKDWYDIRFDAWKKFHSKFLERAYFDNRSHEASDGFDGTGMTMQQRYASFLHLSKYGYEIYKLAWRYLAVREWLGNEEREDYTRESLLATYDELRDALIEWSEENLQDSSLPESLFPDMSMKIFNKDISWRQAAFMFDALCRFAISNPQFKPFAEGTIKEYSLLSGVENKECMITGRK